MNELLQVSFGVARTGSVGITIPEAQRILGVKQYHTARKSIEKLVSVGILKQVGESSYGKTFVAEEILQTIGEGTKQ